MIEKFKIKHPVLLLGFITTLMLSCGQEQNLIETVTTVTTTSSEDQAIDKKIRDEIAVLNEQVIDAILQNNISGLDKIKSENLAKQDKREFENAFTYMNDQLIFKPQEIYKEFHAVSSAPKTQNVLKHQFETGNLIDSIFFQIAYTSPQKESFLSIHRMSTGFCERWLTLIYARYENEWKLDYMAVGVFKIDGLTSPEHFEIAKKHHSEGKVLEALMSYQTAQMCSAPIYEILTFENYDDFESYGDTILDNVNKKYPLPIDLNKFGVKGEIIGISLAPKKDSRYHPIVTYTTGSDMNDIRVTEKENIALHEKIEKILPGIQTGFYGVIYRLYSEHPDSNANALTYNFFRMNPNFKSEDPALN